MTMCPSSEQVQDVEHYNELIQTYQIVFMNIWYIKPNGSRVGDDYDDEMN